MKIIYIDVDSLRPDHLSCYGYHRNTSPNIDYIANNGTRFDNYYASDAPCAPSRTAMFSSQFGIHNGLVNHGGLSGDKRPIGKNREFNSNNEPYQSWVNQLKNNGHHTTMISPFPSRHAAWHVQEGFIETYDTGKDANEKAHEISEVSMDWLEKNGNAKSDWFLYVNFWDPHTPYRTPDSFGNPFEADPAPTWLTQDIINRQQKSFGPRGARNLPTEGKKDSLPSSIENLKDYKTWIDSYDTAIRYVDEHIGKLLRTLEEQEILHETIIIISADHGENQGELNIYGDHQTADHITNRVPCIISGPGIQRNSVAKSFHYQVDLGPTLVDLIGGEQQSCWDGQSFFSSLINQVDTGRDYLVLSQAAWSCQRAVRFDNWIMIRTYHDGLKDFPEIMLFNLINDPHETENLAQDKPDIVGKGMILLDEWYSQQMATSNYPTDPMWQVIHEGGPYHTRGDLESLIKNLKQNNEIEAANRLIARHKYVGRFEY